MTTNSKHKHYFKELPAGMTHIDVYAVIRLFQVTDPCSQHALKKILCPGVRGGGKDEAKDLQEVIDTMTRKLELDALFAPPAPVELCKTPVEKISYLGS